MHQLELHVTGCRTVFDILLAVELGDRNISFIDLEMTKRRIILGIDEPCTTPCWSNCNSLIPAQILQGLGEDVMRGLILQPFEQVPIGISLDLSFKDGNTLRQILARTSCTCSLRVRTA